MQTKDVGDCRCLGCRKVIMCKYALTIVLLVMANGIKSLKNANKQFPCLASLQLLYFPGRQSNDPWCASWQLLPVGPFLNWLTFAVCADYQTPGA